MSRWIKSDESIVRVEKVVGIGLEKEDANGYKIFAYLDNGKILLHKTWHYEEAKKIVDRCFKQITESDEKVKESINSIFNKF